MKANHSHRERHASDTGLTSLNGHAAFSGVMTPSDAAASTSIGAESKGAFWA